MAASKQIHVFYGNDDGRVKEAALQLARKLAPPDNEFGLEIVSGGADNSEHAARIVAQTIEALQTMPFFGGEKVVWLQDVNFFTDNQTGKAETTLAALENLGEVLKGGLPPDVTLIVSATDVNKSRRFGKALLKAGAAKAFDKEDTSKAGWETRVMAEVAKRARAVNLEFSGDALERFVLTVGSDTRSLVNELEKLSLFVGGRPATEEDVRRTASRSLTGTVFEIGEALCRRDLHGTLELIDRELRQGGSAVGILLASIVPRIRRLLIAAELFHRHGVRPTRNYPNFLKSLARLPPAATAPVGRSKEGKLHDYQLFFTMKSAERFTPEEAAAALEACLEANRRLVTTGMNPRLVLDQLVARIAGPRPA